MATSTTNPSKTKPISNGLGIERKDAKSQRRKEEIFFLLCVFAFYLVYPNQLVTRVRLFSWVD